MALCSTPCSLAALPAELPACLPERTVAELSGQGCPGWLAPAWTASIRTISALQNKHRIALNRSFTNEVHGARGSLG